MYKLIFNPKKAYNLSILIGHFLIFYWSLSAPLVKILREFQYQFLNEEKTNDFVGAYYESLIYKIDFSDSSYLNAYIFYIIFFVIILLVGIFTKKYIPNKDFYFGFSIKNFFIINILLLTILLIRYFPIFTTSRDFSELYLNARFDYSPLETLASLSSRLLYLAFAFYYGCRINFSKVDKSFKSIVLNILFITLVGISFLFGNKNDLFWFLILLIIFSNSISPLNEFKSLIHKNKIITFLKRNSLIFLAIIVLILIQNLRGNNLESLNLIKIILNFSTLFLSLESYAAHLSLPAVLNNISYTDISIGGGFIQLFKNLFSIFFGNSSNLYDYEIYTELIQYYGKQGITIHYLTSWFLNFGFLGILLGSIIFSNLWFSPRFLRLSSDPKILFFQNIYPFIFVAQIPQILRTGIEGFKGLLFDCYIIPLIFVFFLIQIYKPKHE